MPNIFLYKNGEWFEIAKNGEDGKDAKINYNKIISEVLSLIPKPKDGKDGTEIEPETIVEKLNSLNESINVSVIKGAITKEDVKNTVLDGMKEVDGRIKLIDQRWRGAGLSKVSHDTTLIGDGTPSNPLEVNPTIIPDTSVFLHKNQTTNPDTTVGTFIFPNVIANKNIIAGQGTTTTILPPANPIAYGMPNQSSGYDRTLNTTYNYRIYSYNTLFNQLYYSSTYQSVSFTDNYGSLSIVENLTVTPVAGTGYPAGYIYYNKYVTPYKEINGVKYFYPGGGTNIYLSASSSTYYDLRWDWDAVANADGYLITGNGEDYYEEHRFVTTNSLLDDNTGWISGGYNQTNYLGTYMNNYVTWDAVAGAEGYLVLVDTQESPGYSKRGTTLTNYILDTKFTSTSPIPTPSSYYSDTSYFYGQLRTNTLNYIGTPSIVGDDINYLTFSTSGIALGYNTRAWDNTINIGLYNLENVTAALPPTNTVAIGLRVMRNLTGLAQESTVIGYGAAQTVVDSYTSNTTIGAGANYSGNGASYSTFVGYHAGYSATGAFNVYLGYNAGAQSTTANGSGNVGIGVVALRDITSGSNNLALGYNAGLTLTTGNTNVMIGYLSANTITAGANNAFIGYYSGYGLTTANNTTYLGFQSGFQALVDDDPYVSTYKDFKNGNINTVVAIGQMAICHRYQGIVLGRPRGNSSSNNVGDSFTGINIPYPMYHLTVNGTQMIVDTQVMSATECVANGTFNTNLTGWTYDAAQYQWASSGGGITGSSACVKKFANGLGTFVQAIASMSTAPVVGNIYVLNFGVYNITGSFKVSLFGVDCNVESSSEINQASRYQIVIRALNITSPLTITSNTTTSRFTLDDISIRQVTGGDLIIGNDTYIQDAGNIELGSVTGTKIGTATTQKLSFYGVTPVVQQSSLTDLGTILTSYGLRPSGSAYPITTTGVVTIPQIDGSTAANGDLTLQGTTNATRTTSYVNLQPNGGFVGVGTIAPVAPLGVVALSATALTTLTGLISDFTSNTSSYAQVNIRNTNTAGSGDFVITAVNGSDTLNYLNLGANNSAYSNGAWTINGAGDAYLYSNNNNLSIGTAGAKYLSFFTNGTLAANERMRITSAGFVGIGTTAPNSTLHAGGSLALGYRATSSLRTLDETDYTVECITNSFTLTLPTSIGITGRVYNIKNSGTGTITVATTSSQLIDGLTTQIVLTGNNMQVQSNGTNWIII